MYLYELIDTYIISFCIDFKRNFSFLMRVLPGQPKIPGFLVGLSFLYLFSWQINAYYFE